MTIKMKTKQKNELTFAQSLCWSVFFSAVCIVIDLYFRRKKEKAE